MNSNQQFIVSCISNILRNENIKLEELYKVDLVEVFMEAEKQDLVHMIYFSLNKLNLSGTEEKVVNGWKNGVLYSLMRQTQFVEQMGKVLKAFNEENVQVIVLKGLVLKELYPEADLRSMVDADLLVHKEDMKLVEKILSAMGYYQGHSDSKHTVFLHNSYLSVEIHWKIVDTAFSKEVSYFENNVWNNKEKTIVCKEEVYSLSLEYQLFHLCLHMAVHLYSVGFGIRQLCDVVVLVESKMEEIDWDKFYDISIRCDIWKFNVVLFHTCELLFKMKLPDIFLCEIKDDTGNINNFLDYLFTLGIYSEIEENSVSVNIKNPIEKLKFQIAYIFPTKQNLNARYSYAKKHYFLTPIAWLHRFFYILTKREGIEEKQEKFYQRTKIMNKRNNILKWLDLK